MDICKILKSTFVYRSLSGFYRDYKKREKRASCGNDYADKTFYIIGQHDEVGGLWWLINKVLMHLWYAEDKGYVPVVDLKHFKTQYTDPSLFGKVNVWEMFFEQPCGYTLDDIKNAKSIIINKQEPYPYPKYFMGNFYSDKERIKLFNKLFNKYIKFNENTLAYLDSKVEEIFPSNEEVVGVLCRGTDYVVKKPKNHPVQPDPLDVISDVKHFLKTKNLHYVFLATEDQDIFEAFKESFGDYLLSVDQLRIRKNQIANSEFLAEVKNNIASDRNYYKEGLDYISATYMLSKCDYFFSGMTGGCKGVLIMSSKFKYVKIYNLGMY